MEKKASKKIGWIKGISNALISAIQMPAVRDWLINLLLKLLKMQALGGVRGWLIKKVVTEFQEEVVETIEIVTDYKVSKETYDETRDMQDRDRATDILNTW